MPLPHTFPYNPFVDTILLQTKLYRPPLRPLLVPRTRLLTQLNAGRQGKLSLVAAPAGFGKTTLVVHWLQAQKQPVAWLSLDESDNEPLRFFIYLLAAMQTIDPALGANLAAALHSTNPPEATAVVPALLNELSSQQTTFILVLDDYHVISDGSIHKALATFIDHLPANIHLVITSREAPPLPLPRWRVRGQLSDIQAADLRFTTDEALLFLRNTMGLDLTATAVADLEARTEGWIAGLQLAALSLRNGGDAERLIAEFAGSERQVADYLLQEVLLKQSEAIQQFLLETAILDRFNAALCDDLLAQTNSQDILDELEQSNLFIIPLDNSRYWYRYHHLFAQLLRYRLQRDESATAVADLHRRASHWYATQDLREEAITHAFRIPDYDAVAQLINKIPLQYGFEEGGNRQIQQWVKQLPRSLMLTYPYVAVLMVGASLTSGQAQTTYEYLDLIAADDTMQAFKDLFRSILIRNENADHQHALHLAQRALNNAAGQDALLIPMAWQQIAVNYYNLGELEAADEAVMEMRQSIRSHEAKTLFMQLQAIDMQVINAHAQGNLYRAQQLCFEGIDLAIADQQPRSPYIGILYSRLGYIFYTWNDLAQAEQVTNKALDWARRTGIVDIFTSATLLQANLACQRGDKPTLQAALSQLITYFNLGRMERIRATAERLAAWFWLRIGELATAVQWANTSGLSLQDDPAYHDFDTYHTLIAVRLAESRHTNDKQMLPQMLLLMGKLEALVITSRHVLGLVEALALKALILDYQGDAAALTTIQKALDLARPSNIKRLFLDWGDPMRGLLMKTVAYDPIFVGELLAAFEDEEVTAVTPAPAIQLTSRENEILQLIAAGLSNKQIEEKLFISKNTVRTHIKNLYSKLTVTSRTQAIKQAHEHNLLQ